MEVHTKGKPNSHGQQNEEIGDHCRPKPNSGVLAGYADLYSIKKAMPNRGRKP